MAGEQRQGRSGCKSRTVVDIGRKVCQGKDKPPTAIKKGDKEICEAGVDLGGCSRSRGWEEGDTLNAPGGGDCLAGQTGT